jgi:arylsulfatase A-like enzyme
MDNSIGILLDKLKKENLDKNTLVIFMSDNGAMENWDSKTDYKGILGPNYTLGDNSPLRDWKTSNYEGAIRVPCVFYWKGQLKSCTNESYISVIDLLPSFLFLAGDENLPPTIEGKNVWSAISENKAIPNQEIYVRGHLQESLIQKPWKIIRTRHLTIPADYELYNIEKDLSEKNNVILQNETLAEKMKIALENQFKKDAKEVNLNGIK